MTETEADQDQAALQMACTENNNGTGFVEMTQLLERIQNPENVGSSAD